MLDDMSTPLGCGAEWSWEVRTREGALVAKPSSIAWDLDGDRRLNDTGQVNLTVQAECCSTIDNVETGDELRLYRDRRLVWFGVTKKVPRQAPFGAASLIGFDRSWWLNGRFFAFTVNWTNRDAGLILADLLAANAAVDPLVALAWLDPPAGNLLGETMTIVPTSTTHFDQVLDSLAATVLDWTVLGDKILVGLEGTGVPALPMLDGDSWEDGRFTTVQDHDLYASEVSVDGQNALVAQWPPATLTPPFAPAPNARWGNRRVRVADSLLGDVASCLRRARAEYEMRNPPQRRLAAPAGALIDAGVSFDQLVPGASVVVAAPSTCATVTLIDMLLATVKWDVTGGVEDSVTVALVEKGTPLAAA